MEILSTLCTRDIADRARRFWAWSAQKLERLYARWKFDDGAPVFTVHGQYTSRGWTDWTRGFLHGSALLQYEATGEESFLRMGMDGTLRDMTPYVTHFGVHDHGFNCISTFGTLWRWMEEGRLTATLELRRHVELALQVSGCVQARRWTDLGNGFGYVYSFNGPHSLFVDTLRSMRSLALAHRLGAALHGEQDRVDSLLVRWAAHLRTTLQYNVYYGEGRDIYDEPGRVAHESLFNPLNGSYRCPSTQQGYSPFSTWTRGLAWALLGCAEELEFTDILSPTERGAVQADELVAALRRAATVTAEFYVRHSSLDGLPPWDTGAPGLTALGDWRSRPADPWNDHEPFDSSAAAIAAQGFLRFGHWLARHGEPEAGRRWQQAGLTLTRTLLDPAYLIEDEHHEGLLRHAVYHRPRGWDAIPPGRRIPCGESCLWGDYHLRELVLYVQRMANGGPLWTFFGSGFPAEETLL
jgi:hypothetical protein